MPLQCGDLEKKKVCPGCSEKPPALKTDNDGNCVTICRMGQLEYIHKLITEDAMTQQGAAESFIEALRAHAKKGDPITSKLTVEMVRAQYRRDSGKLKDKPRKFLVEPTKETEHSPPGEPSDNSYTREEKQYKCLPTVAGAQSFLNQYLPGYKIVSDNHSGGT